MHARVSIRRAIVAGKGGAATVSTPKTGRGRVVDLDPGTVAVLRQWRKDQAAEKMHAGPAWRETGLVFTLEDGGALHPDNVSHAFVAAVRASEQPRIRFHDLRHTHATLCLKAGVPAKVVSERLGHSSIAITLDTYSHVAPGMQGEAAAVVADLVAGAAVSKTLANGTETEQAAARIVPISR